MLKCLSIQGILYVDGWCNSIQTLFFKTAITLKLLLLIKLKHEIGLVWFKKLSFERFSGVCFQWNRGQADLVLCNFVWLEQLNAEHGIL